MTKLQQHIRIITAQFANRIEKGSRILLNNINDKKIVFLHIPKCGGTSITSAIASVMTSHWEGYIDPIKTRQLAQSILGENHYAEGSPILFHIRQAFFYKLLMEKRSFIFGHFPLITEHLVNPEEYIYITMLREPHQRFISQFRYYIATRFNAESLDQEKLNQIWKNYIDSNLSIFHGNVLTAYLDQRGILDLGSKQSLERAKHNIKYFKVIGFLDKMENFSKDFEQEIGKKIRIEIKNNTSQKLKSAGANQLFMDFFDEQKIYQIEKLCSSDNLLYQFAQSQFQ